MRVAVQQHMKLFTEDSTEEIGIAEVFVILTAAANGVVVHGPDAQPAIKTIIGKALFEPLELRLSAKTVMSFVRTIVTIHGSIVAFIHRGIQAGDDDPKIIEDEK
jgi:hypothetical protein